MKPNPPSSPRAVTGRGRGGGRSGGSYRGQPRDFWGGIHHGGHGRDVRCAWFRRECRFGLLRPRSEPNCRLTSAGRQRAPGRDRRPTRDCSRACRASRPALPRAASIAWMSLVTDASAGCGHSRPLCSIRSSDLGSPSAAAVADGRRDGGGDRGAPFSKYTPSAAAVTMPRPMGWAS